MFAGLGQLFIEIFSWANYHGQQFKREQRRKILKASILVQTIKIHNLLLSASLLVPSPLSLLNVGLNFGWLSFLGLGFGGVDSISFFGSLSIFGALFACGAGGGLFFCLPSDGLW